MENLTEKLGENNFKEKEEWVYLCPNCGEIKVEDSPDLKQTINCGCCGHMYDEPYKIS